MTLIYKIPKYVTMYMTLMIQDKCTFYIILFLAATFFTSVFVPPDPSPTLTTIPSTALPTVLPPPPAIENALQFTLPGLTVETVLYLQITPCYCVAAW